MSASAWGSLTLNEAVTPASSDNCALPTVCLQGPSESFTIGRQLGNDWVLQNPCISGLHCVLSYVMSSGASQQSPCDGRRGDGVSPRRGEPSRLVTLADMSTNGIYVNNTLVGKGKTMSLHDGDLIELVRAAREKHALYNLQYRLLVAPVLCPQDGPNTAHPAMMGPSTQEIPAPPLPQMHALPQPPPPSAPAPASSSRQEPAPPPPPTDGDSQLMRALLDEYAPRNGRGPSSSEQHAATPPSRPVVAVLEPTPPADSPATATGDQDATPANDVVHNLLRLLASPEKKPSPVQIRAPAAKALPDTQLSSQSAPVVEYVKRHRHEQLEDVFYLFQDTPLGSGSFATVYKAARHDQKLMGPFFAVKVINKRRLAVGELRTPAVQARSLRHHQNGGMAMVLPATVDDDVEKDGSAAATESTAERASTRALEQLMAIDSDTDEDDGEVSGPLLLCGDHHQKRARNDSDHTSEGMPSGPQVPLRRFSQHVRQRAVAAEKRHTDLLRQLTPPTLERYERYLKEKLRWRREVAILRSVRHPHIVRTYDVFDTDARLALVLEFAEGKELLSVILAAKVLPEIAAKLIVYQLLAGLVYLHRRGIVHRDIKLENILLGRPFNLEHFLQQCAAASSRRRLIPQRPSIHGGPALCLPDAPDCWPDVKITDFGLARVLGCEAAEMSTMCGTPMYAAPEVTHKNLRIGSGAGYTAAVDVFSLGVVAYAMLTGKPPFPHQTGPDGRPDKQRINYKHRLTFDRRSDTVAPLPALCEEARDLVSGMLQLRPHERLTAEEAMTHPWFAEVRQHQSAPQP